MNVASGGDLIQDIDDSIRTNIKHEQINPRDEVSHEVTIKNNSKLFKIIKNKKIKVNSAHHQSVKNIGESFISSAIAPDNIIEAIDNKTLKSVTTVLDNYIIISKKNYSNIATQLIIEKFPISIFKIIERINIEFLKKNFNDQSQIKVKDYKIDINSRQIFLENKQLKLTEKEVHTKIGSAHV